LAEKGVLFVKQKVGCLPYQEDPHGYKSIHSQCMMKDAVHGWTHDVSMETVLLLILLSICRLCFVFVLSLSRTDPSFALIQTNELSSFSSDPIVLNFARLLLIPRAQASSEAMLQHKLASLLFHCASNETVDSLAALIQLIKTFYCERAQHSSGPMQQHSLGQLRLLTDHPYRWNLMTSEFFLGLRLFVEDSMEAHASSAVSGRLTGKHR
jgi:hypothetical protein